MILDAFPAFNLTLSRRLTHGRFTAPQLNLYEKYPKLGYFALAHIFWRMDIEANKKIGNVLRRLRKERGLRQTYVAERLGKPQSYVSKIESGEKSLHLYEVFNYADAIQTPRLELIGHVEKVLMSDSAVLHLITIPTDDEGSPSGTDAQ